MPPPLTPRTSRLVQQYENDQISEWNDAYIPLHELLDRYQEATEDLPRGRRGRADACVDPAAAAANAVTSQAVRRAAELFCAARVSENKGQGKSRFFAELPEADKVLVLQEVAKVAPGDAREDTWTAGAGGGKTKKFAGLSGELKLTGLQRWTKDRAAFLRSTGPRGDTFRNFSQKDKEAALDAVHAGAAAAGDEDAACRAFAALPAHRQLRALSAHGDERAQLTRRDHVTMYLGEQIEKAEQHFKGKLAQFRNDWEEVTDLAKEMAERLADDNGAGDKGAADVLHAAMVNAYRNFMLLGTFAASSLLSIEGLLRVARQGGWDADLEDVVLFGGGDGGGWEVLADRPVKPEYPKVVDSYAEFFTQGDKEEAERELIRRRELSGTSSQEWFGFGFTSGMIFPLLLLLSVVATGRAQPDFVADVDLWAALPLFRGFAVLYAALWLWALALHAMDMVRINYPFVLELDNTSVLSPVQVCNIAALLSASLLLLFSLYITDARLGWELIPFMPPGHALRVYVLLAAGMPAAVLLCPFDVLYRPTRLWLLKTLGRIAVTPWYSVTFADNFLCDYLTSMVKVLVDMWYTACTIATGRLHRQQLAEAAEVCAGRSYAPLVITLLPYVWRLVQCLRRVYDARRDHEDADVWKWHIVNAGKYAASLLALIAGWTYDAMDTRWRYHESHWSFGKLLMLGLLVFSTLYAYWWDINKDWGLFRGWKWHRVLTGLPPCAFQAMMMVGDLVGRCAWAFTLIVKPPGTPEQANLLVCIAALVEVARRSAWAVLRIANEHWHNVSGFRATRASVPVLVSKGTKLHQTVQCQIECNINQFKKLQQVEPESDVELETPHDRVSIGENQPLLPSLKKRRNTRRNTGWFTAFRVEIASDASPLSGDMASYGASKVTSSVNSADLPPRADSEPAMRADSALSRTRTDPHGGSSRMLPRDMSKTAVIFGQPAPLYRCERRFSIASSPFASARRRRGGPPAWDRDDG